MIISISGNILSGKSTLAKKISTLYGYRYVPSTRPELSFLDDFFDNIPQHFFVTQTSFLVSKVLDIEKEVKNNKNVVIDRSLFEDINIFARYWMDNYPIDEREKSLYYNLANYIINKVPKTDIYIYCKCSYQVLAQRYKQRPRRSFENKYPNDHLQHLCQKYEEIVFPNDSIVVEVDTEYIDFSQDHNVIDLMRYIEYKISDVEDAKQLSFFTENAQEKNYKPYIKILHLNENNILQKDIFNKKKKTIYIAAPFTEFAQENDDNDNNNLKFEMPFDREYYIHPKKYQNFLNKISKLLLSIDEYEVILPHKDENAWGKIYISNEQIINSMISNINSSDLIVAIISNSIGVYMEVAMMAILNKPMVLFVVDDLSNGFYANGLRNRKHTLVINVQSINDVIPLLKNENVISFIKREIENDKI